MDFAQLYQTKSGACVGRVKSYKADVQGPENSDKEDFAKPVCRCCARAARSLEMQKDATRKWLQVSDPCTSAVIVTLITFYRFKLLNQYSPVPRARSSTAGKDATQIEHRSMQA